MKRTRYMAKLEEKEAQLAPVSPYTRTLLEPPENNGTTQEKLDEQRFQLVKRKEANGKHANVLFATRTNTPTPTTPGPTVTSFAIKKQLIKSPFNLDDRSYREVFILQQLNKLQHRKEYYPGETSYVGFVNWFKGTEDEQYMHYVLECADFTLAELRSMSLYEYKCLLFQVLFALYVAQKEFEFMHNDLHVKNILLVRPEVSNQYCKFQDGNTVWYTSGLLVKITDFGLSRIRLESGRVVYDKRQPVQSVFLPHKDVEQVCVSDSSHEEVFAEFSKIRISSDELVSEEEVYASMEKGESFAEVEKRMIQEKKRQLNNLKSLGRKEVPLKELIRHPFFEELNDRRENFVSPVPKKKQKVQSKNITNDENAHPNLVNAKVSANQPRQKKRASTRGGPKYDKKMTGFTPGSTPVK